MFSAKEQDVNLLWEYRRINAIFSKEDISVVIYQMGKYILLCKYND